MKNWIKDILSTVPNAIAAPFDKWHVDNLNAKLHSERMRYEHEERMEAMYLREEQAATYRAYIAMIREAIKSGDIKEALGSVLLIGLPNPER